MALLCPICKSPAQQLSRSGDAIGFYCTTHGHFKVADTIAVDKYYTLAEWEVALRSASTRRWKGMACDKARGLLQIAESKVLHHIHALCSHSAKNLALRGV